MYIGIINYYNVYWNYQKSEDFVESLSFVIHPDKSIFGPTRCIEYLGLVLNPGDMTIFLSDIKEEKIKLLCSEILKH